MQYDIESCLAEVPSEHVHALAASVTGKNIAIELVEMSPRVGVINIARKAILMSDRSSRLRHLIVALALIDCEARTNARNDHDALEHWIAAKFPQLAECSRQAIENSIDEMSYAMSDDEFNAHVKENTQRVSNATANNALQINSARLLSIDIDAIGLKFADMLICAARSAAQRNLKLGHVDLLPDFPVARIIINPSITYNNTDAIKATLLNKTINEVARDYADCIRKSTETVDIYGATLNATEGLHIDFHKLQQYKVGIRVRNAPHIFKQRDIETRVFVSTAHRASIISDCGCYGKISEQGGPPRNGHFAVALSYEKLEIPTRWSACADFVITAPGALPIIIHVECCLKKFEERWSSAIYGRFVNFAEAVQLKNGQISADGLTITSTNFVPCQWMDCIQALKSVEAVPENGWWHTIILSSGNLDPLLDLRSKKADSWISSMEKQIMTIPEHVNRKPFIWIPRKLSDAIASGSPLKTGLVSV